jgi:hypothetical protein
LPLEMVGIYGATLTTTLPKARRPASVLKTSWKFSNSKTLSTAGFDLLSLSKRNKLVEMRWYTSGSRRGTWARSTPSSVAPLRSGRLKGRAGMLPAAKPITEAAHSRQSNKTPRGRSRRQWEPSTKPMPIARSPAGRWHRDVRQLHIIDSRIILNDDCLHRTLEIRFHRPKLHSVRPDACDLAVDQLSKRLPSPAAKANELPRPGQSPWLSRSSLRPLVMGNGSGPFLDGIPGLERSNDVARPQSQQEGSQA